MKFDLGHIKKLVVVHAVLKGNAAVFHYLTLKKVKDEIQFLAQGEGFSDLDDLLKKTGKNLPVVLHFSGKGILNKKAIKQENFHHSILLNANIDAFYFTDYLEEKYAFSSVIRKDVVGGYLTRFAENDVHIISISSGPFHAALLGEIINKPNLVVMATKLSLKADSILDFSKIAAGEEIEQRYILLGNERIPNNLIPCAAAGAAFFNPNPKVVFPENETVFTTNFEEAKQKNIFTRFGMGMLFFFLVLLFTNYMYLGHLNQVVMDNEVYLSEYNEQLANIADLEDEKNRKEKLLQSSGLLNKNFLSFYLMEIANSVPNEIIFDEIVLRPLKEEIKQRKKIAFEEHLVLVNGRAETSHELSKWIEKMEEKEWLSKVDILRYEYLKNEGVFELEMIVY